MPIDNRKVLQNIRIHETTSETGEVVSPRRILTAEDADEIQSMFSQGRLDEFIASGVLEGEWKATGKSEAKEDKKK